MAKSDSWGTLHNINQTIRFNDGASLPDGTPGFYPITIVTNAQAISDAGGIRDIQKMVHAGNPRAEKFTPTELANLVKGSSNSTGNFLLTELTAVYTDGIGGIV